VIERVGGDTTGVTRAFVDHVRLTTVFEVPPGYSCDVGAGR
jgi:hypothetical protein